MATSFACRVLSWRLDVPQKRAWVRAHVETDQQSPGHCRIVVSAERKARLGDELAKLLAADNDIARIRAAALVDADDSTDACTALLVSEEKADACVFVLRCTKSETMAHLLESLDVPAPASSLVDAVRSEIEAWTRAISDLDEARASPGNILKVCPLAQPSTRLQGNLLWTPLADSSPTALGRKYFAVTPTHLCMFGRDASGAPVSSLPLSQAEVELTDAVENAGTYSWRVQTPARRWTVVAGHGTVAQQWIEALAASGAKATAAQERLQRARSNALASIQTLEAILAREDVLAAFCRFANAQNRAEAVQLFLAMRSTDGFDESDFEALADQCSQPDLDNFLAIFQPHCEAWQSMVEEGEAARVVELARGVLQDDLESDLVSRFLNDFAFTSMRDAAEGELKRRAEVFFGDKVLYIDNESSKASTVRRCPLPQDRARILIGRDESCDVVLSCPKVSRFHCLLNINMDDTIAVTDLGSSQGTFVNGTQIEAIGLRSQDRVHVGTFSLYVGTEI
ncbi:Centrosomal protein of 170 kDa protein B [Hondaea fermentalgiana]|uniref:Centrosomal protein of 170 kDa protein B n=1 Tax=Hondaea fermentalgiana TaxID=2315210 RepID=A0A2R5G316_9STRA|nr:Centrosomal protein of 170 kDa protein B [Hondaea fermentalgiana]|eukprot:GBG25426.1 Centrosomal protein of 170 kDa protein B [Hondaea fermentalgiana]